MGDGFVSRKRRPVSAAVRPAPLRGSATTRCPTLPTGSNDEAPAKAPEATRSRAGRLDRCDLGLARPVPVERALHLDEPDERADEREQDPEPRPAAERRLAAVRPVHLPDLGRDQEPGDRREEDVDDEAEDAADAD